MSTFTHSGKEVTYSITEKNIRINDSYKVEAKSDMIVILTKVRAEAEAQGFTYKRSLRSWLREWQAHNFLYLLHVARQRTGSVDLNEDETKFRRFGYHLLALLYWY